MRKVSANQLASGGKVKDAMEYRQFQEDYHNVVFSKNGIYDQLNTMWNLDPSKPEEATQIQSMAKELYTWMGENIHGKVDAGMEKQLYDYVNTEFGKLMDSKFNHWRHMPDHKPKSRISDALKQEIRAVEKQRHGYNPQPPLIRGNLQHKPKVIIKLTVIRRKRRQRNAQRAKKALQLNCRKSMLQARR